MYDPLSYTKFLLGIQYIVSKRVRKPVPLHRQYKCSMVQQKEFTLGILNFSLGLSLYFQTILENVQSHTHMERQSLSQCSVLFTGINAFRNRSMSLLHKNHNYGFLNRKKSLLNRLYNFSRLYHKFIHLNNSYIILPHLGMAYLQDTTLLLTIKTIKGLIDSLLIRFLHKSSLVLH